MQKWVEEIGNFGKKWKKSALFGLFLAVFKLF
jgi:hypothetical protein